MYNGTRLRNLGNNIASVEILPFFYSDMCLPFFFFVKKIYADTAGNERTCGICDTFKWTLDAVKDIIQNTRGKGYGNGISTGCDYFARVKT